MPILQPEEIREIINAIPSFAFEEKSSRPQTAKSSVQDSIHKRSKNQKKEDDSKVCNICLD